MANDLNLKRKFSLEGVIITGAKKINDAGQYRENRLSRDRVFSYKQTMTLLKPNGLIATVCLTDVCFTAAFDILAKQFPEVGGMLRTIELTGDRPEKGFPGSRRCYVSHTGTHHWFAITVVESKFLVYDSLLFSCNYTAPIKRAVSQLATISAAQVWMAPYQQQRGAVDCGLFAIAACVEFCYEADPSLANYDQGAMRSHFVESISQKYFKVFPKSKENKTKYPSSYVQLLK